MRRSVSSRPAVRAASFGMLLLAGLAGAGTGCGDIGRVTVDLEFPSEDVELRTQALLFRIRELPGDGSDGCDDLWPRRPTSLPQTENVVAYPNRNDVVAAPVRLAPYDFLTIFVYAHASMDVEATEPLAGGCILAPVDGQARTDVRITLEPAPF